MTERFGKRQSDDGTWQVVYAATGHVVTLEGQPLDNLEDHEADEAIDLLDAGEVVPDPSDGP